MDYIARPKYIEKIKQFIDKPIIKILTGMRRVGKSTLLLIIKDDILKDIPNENKIYINFESTNFFNINNSHTLLKYLQPLLENISGKVYFFFDEIQLVSDWEQVINGLRVDRDCDIYLTGSNSTLISGDLATLLAGRYVEVEIYPFSFKEFCSIYQNINISKEEMFEKYVKLGGMPFLHNLNYEVESSMQYLKDIYSSIILKDITQRNNIRNTELLERIINYIVMNIGNTFSANSISKYFKSENRKVAVDTVLNYIKACENAFLIHKVPRYEIQGKEVLNVSEKYYIADHGIREAILETNERDINQIFENIVYMELLRKGYNIKIGKLNNLEIDFVCTKTNNEKIYIQVAYLLASEDTIKREFLPFEKINDNYPKYVISMDKFDMSRNGIKHLNIIDFLLKD